MNIGKKGAVGSVAVAVDKDKGSQYALRWAVDNLLAKGQTLFIVHVKINHQTNSNPRITEDTKELSDEQIKELFLPFRCYCTRKDIQCKDVILEDNDVAKAITEYAAQFAIENLVVGASAKGSFLRRFKSQDLSLSISKAAPEFCNVYIISKGKVSSLRPAIKNVPAARQASNVQPNYRSEPNILSSYRSESAENSLSYSKVENDSMPATRSSFARVGRFPVMARDSEMTMHDVDSSMGNNRRSTDRLFPSSMGDQFDTGRNGRLSNGSSIDADSMCSGRQSFQSPLQYPHKSVDFYSNDIEFSSSSLTHNNSSWSSCSQTQDDLEAEMRRLKLELKQTMDMYSNACKEALSEKQKAMELHRWKIEEQQRLEEAKLAEEAALALVEKEKSKCRAALEAAETAQRIAELESQKRKHAEMKALKESEEKKKALDSLTGTDIRCRRYSIEEIETATEFFSQARKIGEGGYGPVYKCYLDHTEVAVKVLRPDAAQGRMQFQQEVEILSCIRHPNMVLLLGACPEYGCLVYDYMHNGSLEDRLLRRGNTPPLSWQLRFRIAAEIGTGLLFLHQTKPEPLVHRDLKPANILLDRNFVSKISDVGLARLVPPSVANDVTQYRMTSTAGTFCYIDPEYQQTGMLGVKSDVYSLGIMLLQIITAKPAMGLTHHVERAIDKGTFAEMLDPSVPDWPLEAALAFAKMALRCAELRRKDRPDLSTVVLPELNRLRALAEENMVHYNLVASATNCSPHTSLAMMPNQEVISSYTLSSAFTNDESLKSHSSSSASSMFGRRAY